MLVLFVAALRISEDEDDGVAAQKHFADVSVLVDRLGLLFSWKKMKKSCNNGVIKWPSSFTAYPFPSSASQSTFP